MILLPTSTRLNNFNAFMARIHVDSLNIMFYLQELLPLDVLKQSDPLMIIVNVNAIGIRCAPH